MNKCLGLLLIFNIYVAGKCSIIDGNYGKFIVDVTSSSHAASGFTSFLCNDVGNAVEFSKQIAENLKLHDVQNNFENYEFPAFDLRIIHQLFYVLDFECKNSVDLLIKANSSQLFRAPVKWLILQGLHDTHQDPTELMQSQNNLINLFQDFDIFPDSGVFLAQPENTTNNIKLLSLYRPSSYRNLVIENRGFWDNENGLQLDNHDPSSRRRRDLQKTPLKSCLVVTNPDTLNHLTDSKDKFVDTITKVNYPWVLHLVNRMNATINFTVRDTWGYQDENGTWSGMIGLLDSGEIDIGGTATFLIPQRIGVVDYVQLYTPTKSKFLFRRPPLSYVSNLFTLPFSRSVWIAIGIFLILVCGLLYVTMKWESKNITEDDMEKFQFSADWNPNPTISDNLLVILGATSQQGFFYEARMISTRAVILMLLVAALSLYAAYTANIVALLQSTSDSIKTVSDLMNSPLKIGIHDIVYNRYYFKMLDDPVRKEFYDRKVKDKSFVWMNVTEGIEKVRKGLFAFQVEVSAGYQLMQETYEEDEKCGIYEIDILNLLNPLLVIKRNSPYREIIRVGALWIHETGLQKRDLHRLYTEKPACIGKTTFISVGLTECYAAILTIVYGAAITFGIFILELFWHKCIEKNRKSPEPEENNSSESGGKTPSEMDLDLSAQSE